MRHILCSMTRQIHLMQRINCESFVSFRDKKGQREGRKAQTESLLIRSIVFSAKQLIVHRKPIHSANAVDHLTNQTTVLVHCSSAARVTWTCQSIIIFHNSQWIFILLHTCPSDHSHRYMIKQSHQVSAGLLGPPEKCESGAAAVRWQGMKIRWKFLHNPSSVGWPIHS